MMIPTQIVQNLFWESGYFYEGESPIPGKQCWTKHPKKALAEGEDVVCMNTRWQCTPFEADGWEVVWIVEFISAIVGAFID